MPVLITAFVLWIASFIIPVELPFSEGLQWFGGAYIAARSINGLVSLIDDGLAVISGLVNVTMIVGWLLVLVKPLAARWLFLFAAVFAVLPAVLGAFFVSLWAAVLWAGSNLVAFFAIKRQKITR